MNQPAKFTEAEPFHPYLWDLDHLLFPWSTAPVSNDHISLY